MPFRALPACLSLIQENRQMSGRWIPPQRSRKQTPKLPQLRKVPASSGSGPIHKADCTCIGCRAIRDDAETRRRGEKPATYSTHTQDANRLLRIAADGSRAELMPDGTLVPVGMKYATGGVSSTLNGWTISTDSGLFSSIEITETFCNAGAPAGFTNPGFLANFTLGSGACEGCEGCIGFGTDGASCSTTIDFCGCTTMPTTIYADVTGAYTGTVTMTWDGSSKFSGTFTSGECPFTIELTCLSSTPPTFKTAIFSSDPDCEVCNNEDAGEIATCDPFSLSTIIPLGGAGGACPLWELAAFEVTYSE